MKNAAILLPAGSLEQNGGSDGGIAFQADENDFLPL
jgi:hypothetical protein